MKKLAGFLAVSLLTLTLVSVGAAGPAFAEADATVVVGEALTFAQGSEPIIINDRLMLPLRAVSQALDATIYWFDDDKRVQIVLYDRLLSLQIGNSIMGRYTITDGQPEPLDNISMDVPATISNDRTYVPLRTISEAFDAEIQWNNETRTAVIVPQTRTENFLEVGEIADQPEGTLCSACGVLGKDEATGIFYLRSLQTDENGIYDSVSFCTPVKTSLSEDTSYGEYITAYWEEQFGTQDPSGLVVRFSGITSEIDGQQYLVVNKTTTSIRSLGYFDTYMRSLGLNY